MLAIAKVDAGFIGSDLLYFFSDGDLPAVDIVTFLVADSAADLDRRYTTEDLATGTGLCAHFQRGFVQLGDLAVDLGKHLLFLLFRHFHALIELLAVRRTGFHGQALGNQEVAGIPVSYL